MDIRILVTITLYMVLTVCQGEDYIPGGSCYDPFENITCAKVQDGSWRTYHAWKGLEGQNIIITLTSPHRLTCMRVQEAHWKNVDMNITGSWYSRLRIIVDNGDLREISLPKLPASNIWLSTSVTFEPVYASTVNITAIEFFRSEPDIYHGFAEIQFCGETATLECEPRSYGIACDKPCQCWNEEHCDRETGRCPEQNRTEQNNSSNDTKEDKNK